MDENNGKPKLEIAVFPWLAFGHIMPFFQVAKFLAQKGHHVSYISTPKNIHRLPQIPTSLSSRFRLVELPLPHVDGLPQGAESTSELPINKVPYLKKAYDLLQVPLTSFLEESPVDWIIHDFISHWLPSLAAQLGVNLVFFSIYNATTLSFMGPPSELLAGRRQKPEDFTVVPEWIDFPCNVKYKLHEMVSHVEGMDSVSDFERGGRVLQDCRVVTLRSCTEFEPDALRLLGKLLQKPVLPIGLLPPSLQDSPADDEKWRELKDWLDVKENNSVVYVALGTEVTLSRELTHELAFGLEKSALPFIWVVRNRPLVEGQMGLDELPSGFQDRVSGRGLVWTDWAPQLKILAHSSVGGFLTHCGWSSVIEALGLGRVLILLSGANSDLGLVARLMHGRRVGLEIERDERDGSFTSELVAESIRRVMLDPEGETLRANAGSMREIFGNVELNNRYLDEFTQFLENDTTSTRSL